MKKGYKKVLVFDIILLILLLINSFSLNLLSRYKMILFLCILLFVFYKLFGFEKDRHRYVKEIIFDISFLLFGFFILYYLLGVIIGFTVTSYYNLDSLINFIIPIILYVVLREIFRYMIMCKTEGNMLVTVFSVTIFVCLDITSLVYLVDFSNNTQIFKFMALYFIPAISSNIVFSYLTRRTGYKPIIFYALIMELYSFLLPIVPNPSEYLVSLINFLLPVVLGYRIYVFFKKDYDEDLRREYTKKHLLSLLAPAVITLIFVYFTSGYFHYYALAIASGSMVPNINKGDVVIAEKIDKKFDTLNEGKVIVFKKDNRVIVHRLVKIIKNNKHYYFYTKGDANDELDNFVIEENMIIGTVKNKIPFIGWPTVLLSGL
ncbi:MAG: signal peptidase I [Bacilli bacterium]|nr:signal peptidase I [Bacilli bacterium]